MQTNTNLHVYNDMDRFLDDLISSKSETNSTSSTVIVSAVGDYTRHMNKLNQSRTRKIIIKHLPCYQTNKICSVCLRDEEFSGNKIRQCKVCYEQVHERCYIGNIDASFICQRCTEYASSKIKFKDNFRISQCRYCYQTSGITIRVSDTTWSHIHCIMWLFNIKPEEFNTRSVLDGKIPLLLLYNKCNICEEKIDLVKCVIKCGVKSCYFFMHVNCARMTRCIFQYDHMTKLIPSVDEECLRPYCPRHLQGLISIRKDQTLELSDGNSYDDHNL